MSTRRGATLWQDEPGPPRFTLKELREIHDRAARWAQLVSDERSVTTGRLRRELPSL
ncbi:hypothetical protein FTUN_2711 [Frigoriglobus tundricola]|uniref:Uncharacterized protein n=1 Tax=Frigoriglobus tundricola TaxID=2774151 RepID=A0A6M5YQC5_9BACT|nr:hypothetical protein FTUN_2711 [Frigoriglobus tundricola]